LGGDVSAVTIIVQYNGDASRSAMLVIHVRETVYFGSEREEILQCEIYIFECVEQKHSTDNRDKCTSFTELINVG
jgi:hypothetical protein